MTSKLKRPAPCFFPSGVGGGVTGGLGIRELGGNTSLLLLAHRPEVGYYYQRLATSSYHVREYYHGMRLFSPQKHGE